ncbi:MAG: hypothetical protein LBE24_02245 [Methylobacillus sp.]|jgi:hypothetical protein|nr:hypothetical protein [Methylobacillus sp.]
MTFAVEKFIATLKSRTKELVVFCFVILVVQTINLFLFGDIRFSKGLPLEHWGVFFIKNFPTGTWFYIRNGWVFYILCFLLFWLKIRSLTICMVSLLPIVVMIAVFNFIFPPHIKTLAQTAFMHDAIGLIIAFSFVVIVSILNSLFHKQPQRG